MIKTTTRIQIYDHKSWVSERLKCVVGENNDIWWLQYDKEGRENKNEWHGTGMSWLNGKTGRKQDWFDKTTWSGTVAKSILTRGEEEKR